MYHYKAENVRASIISIVVRLSRRSANRVLWELTCAWRRRFNLFRYGFFLGPCPSFSTGKGVFDRSRMAESVFEGLNNRMPLALPATNKTRDITLFASFFKP